MSKLIVSLLSFLVSFSVFADAYLVRGSRLIQALDPQTTSFQGNRVRGTGFSLVVRDSDKLVVAERVPLSFQTPVFLPALTNITLNVDFTADNWNEYRQSQKSAALKLAESTLIEMLWSSGYLSTNEMAVTEGLEAAVEADLLAQAIAQPDDLSVTALLSRFSALRDVIIRNGGVVEDSQYHGE